MNNETRIFLLLKQIENLKSTGRIRRWPDDVRQEIKILSKDFSRNSLAKKLNIPQTTVGDILKRFNSNNTNEIKVTRFSGNIFSRTTTSQTILEIKKNDVTLNCFCKETSKDILESIIKS